MRYKLDLVVWVRSMPINPLMLNPILPHGPRVWVAVFLSAPWPQRKKFGKAIVVGTHGTTYGGNPLACAVVACVMEEMLSAGFMDNVNKASGVLFDGLTKIQRESNKITDIRGKGLMIGVDTAFEIKDVLGNLQENGLMATQAGKTTLRLTPPLIINEDQAGEALDIIDKTLKEMD